MKYFFHFLLVFLLLEPALAQDTGFSSQSLTIIRNGGEKNRSLVFKPTSSLQVRANNGEYYRGSGYMINQNYLIFADNKINLDDIHYIRGRVKGNTGRKALGVTMIAGGALLAWTYIGLEKWSSGWSNGSANYAPAIPFLAISAGGVFLVGKRSFDMEKKWRFNK